MLVTALAPSSATTRRPRSRTGALAHGATLKQEALQTGWVDERTFDSVVDARKMAQPNGQGPR